MNYLLHLMIIAEIYIMLSLSTSLVVQTGILSLAQGAFFGIGAYTTALLMVNLGFGFSPAFVLSIIVSTLLSFAMSLVLLPLKGDHVILGTLGFQVLIFSVLYNWVGLTRGSYGISSIPRPSIAGFKIDSLILFALLGLGIMAIVCGFLTLVFRSPFGRVLRAIRDDETAALGLGKKADSFKARSIAVSGACAAAAGSVYATYMTFIDPMSFTTDSSILILSMVIVGGVGNVKGPAIGALALILISESLRFLALPYSLASNVSMIIYGVLLVLLMRFRPKGLVGRYQFD